MKIYKIMTVSNTNEYACTFEDKNVLGTREYCVYYKYLNSDIQIIEVDVIAYGEWTNEETASFVSNHKTDLFWLRHFMRVHGYPESKAA